MTMIKPTITKYEKRLLSIARHFVWADKMKEKFSYHLRRDGIPKIDPMWYMSDIFMYMGLWYALLFEVLKKLKSENIKVPKVQKDIDNIYTNLENFRNAVFHIEGELHPPKMYKFLKQGASSATKIRKINDEVGKFLAKFMHEVVDKPIG